MPRPRSNEKRIALLEAATRVIVTQGLSAPTAGIAKEAGVPNGSLFTYFKTKTELLNQLYLELKGEMAAAALKGLPAKAEPREQFFRVWQNWTNWAVRFPEKRQALTQLSVSGEITAQSRAAGNMIMADLAEMADRSRANGPMRKAPLGFVLAMMNSVAEATMDYMTQDAPNAKKYCKEGFDALWRMVE
jgi:AcrR family transcriptional regulator